MILSFKVRLLMWPPWERRSFSKPLLSTKSNLEGSAKCSLNPLAASRNIRWIPHDQECLKFNCDGSVTNFGEVAAAGGVLRNCMGGSSSVLPLIWGHA